MLASRGPFNLARVPLFPPWTPARRRSHADAAVGHLTAGLAVRCMKPIRVNRVPSFGDRSEKGEAGMSSARKLKKQRSASRSPAFSPGSPDTPTLLHGMAAFRAGSARFAPA